MIAQLADGPLAGRVLEIDEPRPTIELADDGSAVPAGAGHRYRLASVDVVALPDSPGRHERIGIYAHCAEPARGVVPRAA